MVTQPSRDCLPRVTCRHHCPFRMPFKDLGFAVVVGALGLYSKAVMQWCNDTDIRGKDILRTALHDKERKERGQGLVTVMNHVTAIDDPAAVAVFLTPYELTLGAKDTVRWTLCARDRCFREDRPLASSLLSYGKVLPITRGAGIHQPDMDAVVELLDKGEWVHMFPEGKRSLDGRIKAPLRPGVGRLIADAKTAPVVIPILHRGLEQVLPRSSMVPFTLGKKMSVVVGDPIDLGPVVRRGRKEGLSEDALYALITASIEKEMIRLQNQLDERV
jgi:monolysocardiolipin acyltransferase